MTHHGDVGSGWKAAVGRRGSLVDTFRAVGWSFFGVRRRADLDRDAERLNPVHVIAVGLIAALLFVAGLVVLVNWIVGSGVAT